MTEVTPQPAAAETVTPQQVAAAMVTPQFAVLARGQVTATPAGTSDVPIEPLEDVSFTFEQIEVTSNVGQTTAADSWNTATK